MTTIVDVLRSNFGTGGSPADILCRDAAGEDVGWPMHAINSPGTRAALPAVTPDWHFKAAAQFDATPISEGSDILWQNDNGALALWQMNGSTVSAINALPNPGPTWHVVGDNDFNGDDG